MTEPMSDALLADIRERATRELEAEEADFMRGARMRPLVPTPARRQCMLLDEIDRLRAQRGVPRTQYGVRYPGWATVSEAPTQEAAREWVEEYAALDPGNPRARVQRRTITVVRSATPWEDADQGGAG